MIQYKSINHLNTSLVEREEYYKQLSQDADSPSQFEGNFISETHTPEMLDYVLQSIAESID